MGSISENMNSQSNAKSIQYINVDPKNHAPVFEPILQGHYISDIWVLKGFAKNIVIISLMFTSMSKEMSLKWCLQK